MSQRDSGYQRKANDLYETPEWVTAALLAEGFRPPALVWEPAAGSGKMVRALMVLDAAIIGTDIDKGTDFLTTPSPAGCDCIITNPPYALATEFIHRAIDLMAPNGQVAMLLRTDFDHARTRQNLFSGCSLFAKKLVLTKRIQWFEDSTGSPSFNHAWFIWDHQHKGPPTLAYGPQIPAKVIPR